MTRDDFHASLRGPLRKLLQAALREEASRTRVQLVAGTVTATPAAVVVTEAAIIEVTDILFDAFGADRAREAQPR